MPNKKFKPPHNIIKQWPEVFEEIYMNAMPIAYIHGVELEFFDGRVWQIDIHEQLPFKHEDEVVNKLMGALREMSSEVKTINFSIDIDKLKKDITDHTKNIMKD